MSEPCIRCGNNAIKDGANTEYGRVCQICYQGYFKAKKVCFECGKPKRGVSSYSRVQHNEPICVSCYQAHFRQTCPLCHRYRELVETEKGKICHKCHELGEIPCGSCDKLMPAGMGKRCEDCYWSQRLTLETQVNTYLLSSVIIKQAYTDFTEWFRANKGSMTATLKHNNFINFFTCCDGMWGQIPSYESLVQEFKPNGLRENLTVLRWLIATEQITISLEMKDHIAEEERIVNLIAKFDEDVPNCINEYHKSLQQKLLEGRTSLKSIRLALQPAIGLCIEYEVKSSNTPTQEHIDSYLMVKHGQYNALYGFVTFLNKTCGLSLVCNKPNRDDIQKLKKKEIEQEMMLLYRKCKPLSSKDNLRWLQLSMAHFHQVEISLSTLKALSIDKYDAEMFKLNFNQKEYCLPTI